MEFVRDTFNFAYCRLPNGRIYPIANDRKCRKPSAIKLPPIKNALIKSKTYRSSLNRDVPIHPCVETVKKLKKLGYGTRQTNLIIKNLNPKHPKHRKHVGYDSEESDLMNNFFKKTKREDLDKIINNLQNLSKGQTCRPDSAIYGGLW